MKKTLLLTTLSIILLSMYCMNTYAQQGLFSSSTWPVVKSEITSTYNGGGAFNVVTGVSSSLFITHKTSADMTDGFGSGLIFGTNDNTVTGNNYLSRIYARRDGADNKGLLQFWVGTDGGLLAMTLRATGSVGIGTSAPNKKLEVYQLSTTSVPDNPTIRILREYSGYAHDYMIWDIVNTETGLKFYYGYSTTTANPTVTEQFIFSKEGNFTAKGKIYTEEIEVKDLTTNSIKTNNLNLKVENVADYVFSKDYELKSLNEVENFINKNSHLPGIPSAQELEENGMNVAEMNNLLLEKIEELTLYVIELRKENSTLQQEVDIIKSQLK